MLGNPNEIETLWKMRKERFDYKFHPFLWLPGVDLLTLMIKISYNTTMIEGLRIVIHIRLTFLINLFFNY